MLGPHISGASPVTRRISASSAAASARLPAGSTAAIKAATLASVARVLFSTISLSFPRANVAHPAFSA